MACFLKQTAIHRHMQPSIYQPSGQVVGTTCAAQNRLVVNAWCALDVVLPRLYRGVLDEDVPAFGRNYCPTCSRYFVTEHALGAHNKSKDHKRR